MGLHLKCIIIVLIFGYVYTSIKGLPLSLSNIGLQVPSPNTSQNTSPQGMQKVQINSFHGDNFCILFLLSSMLWYLALWATLILLAMLVPKSAEITTPWIINRAETFLKNVILLAFHNHKLMKWKQVMDAIERQVGFSILKATLMLSLWHLVKFVMSDLESFDHVSMT